MRFTHINIDLNNRQSEWLVRNVISDISNIWINVSHYKYEDVVLFCLYIGELIMVLNEN